MLNRFKKWPAKKILKLPQASHFKAGEEEAFSAIYSRFRVPILKYISGRIANPDDQEEVVQEVFFKAYRFRDSYDQTYAFSTWLWTLARNTTFDWLRKHQARTDSNAIENESYIFDPEAVASELDDAETVLRKKFDVRKLFKFARHLTRLQRRVLWLRVFRQLSHEEIARNLGLSLSAVKNLILRARYTLCEMMLREPAAAPAR
jgi:RNA polymerase sigma-70 factor (ECF subfamily)